MSNSIDEAIEQLSASKDYRVFQRVPESFEALEPLGELFKLAIIDLETTGLDSERNEIIEIGTLIMSFTNEQGFVAMTFSDNQLQQPRQPIPEEITQITGITNEDVAGKSINWEVLEEVLKEVHLIVCHNATFDRQFMEKQTPQQFSNLIKSKAFGCSARDVDWRLLGFEGGKLEYLNYKMGFFYEGHRALVDCWATLNILYRMPEAFEQLKQAVREKQQLVCAINADYDKKDLLKARGYRWSDGSRDLPKCWYHVVKQAEYQAELDYLQTEIYGGRQVNLPSKSINAFSRYSGREFRLD